MLYVPESYGRESPDGTMGFDTTTSVYATSAIADQEKLNGLIGGIAALACLLCIVSVASVIFYKKVQYKKQEIKR